MGFKTLFKGGGSENCGKVADLVNGDRGKEERRQVTQSNWVVTPLRGAAGQRNKIGWFWRRLLPHSSMITFCCRFWRSFSVFDHGLLFATFKGFKSTTLKSCQCNGSWTHAMYSSNKGDFIPQMEEGMMGGGVRIGDNKGDFIPQGKTVFTLCVPVSTAGDSLQWNMEIVQLLEQTNLMYHGWMERKVCKFWHSNSILWSSSCYCDLGEDGVVSAALSIQSPGWSMCPKRPLSS